jgi:MFS family permease
MKVAEQRSLTREQKEAVGLLSIGTFLEYFDVMLYVHMAVLLNELFFPQTDPFTASLISALSFCSIFVFRPFGALIFGYIGDNIGRKNTVVITTFLMATSCIVMANLPTYAQIGITASWLITICRALQGVSSMGEVIGAEIYLTEITKPPIQYAAVSIITVFATVGGCAALAVAWYVTNYGLDWRIAFWIGAIIALIGAKARKSLRETPEFVDAKTQLKLKLSQFNISLDDLKDNPILKRKPSKKTFLAYFFIECAWPVTFYFIFVYCSNILKNVFNYTPEQIIEHNLIISLINLCGFIIVTFLSTRIYPLKILRVKFIGYITFAIVGPYILFNINSAQHLLLLQAFIILLISDSMPSSPIFYKHFPVFSRFTSATLVYACSRALMYVVSSFGLVYLEKAFSNYGLFFLFGLVAIGLGFGLFHFEKLDRESMNPSQ